MPLSRYGRSIESLGDRYVLEEMLGSGGMAEVFKAYDEYERRDVAIKILRPDAFLDRDTMSRFVKEAGQIVSWRHPHILRVYDHMQTERLDVDQFLFYIVMEYANGGDLQKRLIPGKPYSLRSTFTIVRQLCDAVGYAHKHGIIHRDLKPLNVLFRQPRTGPEEVVLSDFGLAVQVDASHHTFAQAGTLSYMAPEQFDGQAEPASDIFALGVVLYQLSTGEMPFRRSLQDLSFLDMEQETPPPSPSAINPALPRKLDGVILHALEPFPAARYRSAEEFWNAIAFVLRQTILPSEKKPSRPSRSSQSLVNDTKKGERLLPSPARPATRPSRIPQTIQFSQSNPGSLIERKETIPPTPRRTSRAPSSPSTQQTSEESSRRMPRRLLLVGAGVAALSAAGGGALLFSHFAVSGHNLAKATSTVTGGQPSRTASPSSTPRPTQTASQTLPYIYHGHKSDITGVAWSPDGSTIASSDFGIPTISPATVQVWTTTGQNQFTYTMSGGHAVTGVTWSNDGTRVAWCGTDNNASIWTRSTNHVTTYFAGSAPNSISWSPQGTQIAVGNSDGTVHIWNPVTGANQLTLNGHKDRVNGVAWSPDGSMLASGSDDKTVRIWTTTGQNLFTYTGQGQGVSAIAWSPNGQRIVSSGDGVVQTWDAQTGLNVVTHADQLGNIVAWSPKDARRIASDDFEGSSQFLVDIWDATTGANVSTYKGHTQQVSALAWSPNGERIASGSYDNTVQIWNP
jgi:serine/threonine protein kinase